MRVIAGIAKGHKLKCPKGRIVRPTADRVREAIFSMLGGRVEGTLVLDLFAGAGTLGIEALSRGATGAAFVERSARIAAVLRQNLEKCGLADKATVEVGKVSDYLSRAGRATSAFDLIFLDPPYRIADTEVDRVLKGLVEWGFLAEGGLIVMERPGSALPAMAGPLIVRNGKVYGETRITVFEKRAVGEE